MEALSVRSPSLRGRRSSPEEQLQDLRPLGEAYLVRRFGNSLNRADAEDAVADVVFRLHKRIESGRAPDNLRAAFFTSVRNAAIDHLRSRNTKPTVTLEAVADAATEDLGPVERAESHEDSVRLQEALARMRGNYRETIVLRFGVGMTVPEIAERLHISLPAAKKLVLRATEQARKRLAAIEGAEFCPEMRDLVRRRLFDKEAEGMASVSEQRILRAHVSHCGSCKTFLAELRHDLHEIGGTMLLAGGAGAGVGHHVGIADHIGRLFGHASDAAQGAASRLRMAAFKAGGALQGGDGATVGGLGTTAQKVAAVCGAATATTATCLATGVVGPGVGGIGADHGQPHSAAAPPAQTSTLSELPTAAPPEATEAPPESPPTSTPSPKPEEESSPPPEPETSPNEAASEEFGFESSASGSSSTPAAAEPPPAPPPAPPPSSGGGGSGGGESFGFGG